MSALHLASFNLFPILLFGALTVSGCTGGKDVDASLTSEERYQRGIAELDDEDYLDAIRHFETLLLQDPASELADDAQFHLGEAYYRQGEYYTAAFQYSRVLTEFRGSPYYKRALYMTGESYYQLSPRVERDQKRTEQAIRQYQAFLQYFPNDSLATPVRERIHSLRSKLAEQEYTIALSYLERERFKAATIYFQRIIDTYSDTEYATLAREKLAEAQRMLSTEEKDGE